MNLEQLKEAYKQHDGYSIMSGIEITKAEDGYAEGEIVVTPAHKNPINSVHGGCIFTLADTIGGTALITTGVRGTTLSGNIDYLNAAIDSKKIIAKAAPLRVGNKIAVYNVDVVDETDRLIAKVSITYYILRNLA